MIIGRQFLANGQPNFLGSLIRKSLEGEGEERERGVVRNGVKSRSVDY